MARLNRKQLNSLKKKYGVDTIWSWSRFHRYKQDAYSYLLKYIKKEKETKKNIYGVEGGAVHDTLESFYNNKIKYEDMIVQYEENLFNLNMAEFKYDRNDDKKNRVIGDKYENNIRLFFKNHIPLQGKVITEQFVTIKVGNNIFQGYIDFMYVDANKKLHILDWKTSTMYVGKKIEKERGQLVLYAEAMIQKGIKLEDIIIEWNFLKYCNIEYQMKSIDKKTGKHKTKITKELRDRWVKKIEKNLRMWLEAYDYNELEIEDLIQTCKENNNLSCLPQDIQDKYNVTDCYVQIPLTQEIIDDLKEDIISTISEIEDKTNQYKVLEQKLNNTKDTFARNLLIDEMDNLFWTMIDNTNYYFFCNLCGYSSLQHKPFREYIESINVCAKEKFKDTKEDYDDNWLNEL